MLRAEFLEEIADMNDLVQFCYDNGCEEFVWDNNIMTDDERNESINNELSEYNEQWWEVRDWLDNLTDHGSYYWWYLDAWNEYNGIDDEEFERFKGELLEKLDDDGFFDDEEEDEEDEDNSTFVQPVIPEEVLEPGDFAAALGAVEAVPKYDMVVAMNLAKLRAATDERVRVEEELQKIIEESNRLTAGDFSVVF